MNNLYRMQPLSGLEEEMEKELGITDARRQFARIVDEARYRGDTYIIVKHGEPAAAIVPIALYRRWQEQRQELFDVIREMQARNPDADADEVMEEVLAAQQAVRQAP